MKIVSPKSLMERVTVARCGCWIWDGALSKEGYGVLRTEDGHRPAQRLFWETFVGPIPEGYQVRSRKLQVCAEAHRGRSSKTCSQPARRAICLRRITSSLRTETAGPSSAAASADARHGRTGRNNTLPRPEAGRSRQSDLAFAIRDQPG